MHRCQSVGSLCWLRIGCHVPKHPGVMMEWKVFPDRAGYKSRGQFADDQLSVAGDEDSRETTTS